MKVSRPNRVAAERLPTTILCFFMTGRCGQANCKYAHGPRELKHAADLKKTKLCFEFSEGCCQEVPRVPLLIGMKICAPPPAFSRLSRATSSNEVLARRVCGADTRMVSGSCDAHSPSPSGRRVRSLESIDPSSWLISDPRIVSELNGRICQQFMRFPSLLARVRLIGRRKNSLLTKW